MKFYFKFARKQLELTFFQYLVHDQGKDRRERGLKEREGTQLFGGRDHLTEGGNFQGFGHKWGASPDPPPLVENTVCWKNFKPEKQMRKLGSS